jgi:hypothetical protein
VQALSGRSVVDCGGCLVWQLRFQVAIRAYYVAARVASPDVRELVLDDVAAAWAAWLDRGVGKDFEDFFIEYCAEVERSVNPGLRATVEYATECNRAWARHAVALPSRNDASVARVDKGSRGRITS